MKVDEAMSKLEKKRRQKHLSMEAFANRKLEVTRATYSAWVNDKREPKMSNWQKIKDFLEDE